jgi:RNA polymerase sigma factor (TIGR02999 family)
LCLAHLAGETKADISLTLSKEDNSFPYIVLRFLSGPVEDTPRPCSVDGLLLDPHQALCEGMGKTVMQGKESFHEFRQADQANPSSQDRSALDAVFSATYEELRRLASAIKRNDMNASQTPTTLVNEAWLRLRNSPGFRFESPVHFKRIAARAMRQILIEAARRRYAQKRGGEGYAIFVTLDDSTTEAVASSDKELLAVDAALDELGRISPRQAQVVESRFFGGLEVAEIAQLLDISEATVLRDWRAAKAWLAFNIRPSNT